LVNDGAFPLQPHFIMPVDWDYGYDQTYSMRDVKLKTYEIKDHLGNVRVLVSDAKVGYNSSSGGMADLRADISGINNYYPFGMLQPERNFNAPNYRYGFQGQEKDDEVKGIGNSISFAHRIFDPRLGRFLSLDPLTKEYPWYSPYHFAGNTPIQAIDMEGLEPKSVVGEAYNVKTKVGVYTYYRLNEAAITVLHLATGVDPTALKETWLKVDQKFHDNVTKYPSGGAITMGKYIIFTGDFGDPNKKGKDTYQWFYKLAHEVGHRQQANDRSPSGYFLGYLLEGADKMVEQGTSNADNVHDDIPMELEAESYRTKFNNFMKLFEYEDSEGNIKNSIYDILDDENYTDKQKSQLIMDMYIQRTTPKKEENTTPQGNGKG
jgi:RHS repeat-associated protein